MKKTILILLLVFSLLLCGSVVSSSKADTTEYASQQDFLNDMAVGITQRLNDDRDSSQMAAKEKAEFYLTLVGYELDRIEKYETQVFEDSVFNDLAHLYIDACQTQRFAAQNYKNSALYDALWEGGRQTRAAIIVELYSRYDLPITTEQAARYAPSPSYDFSFTIDPSIDSTNSSDKENEANIDEIKKQIELTYLVMHTKKYTNSDLKEHNVLIEAKNNSKYAVYMTVNVIFYKNGTMVDACDVQFNYCTVNEWYAGVAKTKSEFTDIKLAITSIDKQPDLYSYLGDYRFSDMVTITEKRSGKDVLISSKNKLDKAVHFGGYVVFFNNNTVVDCESLSFSLDAGMEATKKYTTRKDYTSYKIYINYIWY